MKTAALLFTLLLSMACLAQEQKPGLKTLLSGRYVFKAQSAIPLSGRTMQLTEGYELMVSKDSVVAYLPYFGRAYNANPYLHEGGIKFTSTNFEYKLKEKRKDRWQVSIEPKDAGDVQQLILNISPSGYASLQVQMINRQPISFNGYIRN